jgi:hypothetical protein
MITESYPFDTTSAIYKVLSAMKTTPKTTQSINVQAPPYTSDYKTDWPSAVGLKFQLIAKDQLGLTSEVKEVTIGITKESSTVTDLITGASNEITDTGTLTTTTFPTLTGSTSENTTYSADSAVSTTPYVPAGNTLVPTTIVLVPQTGVTVENFANTDPTSLSKETGFPTTSFGGATVVKMQVPADGKAKSIILTFDKAIPSDYVLFKKFKKTGDTEVKWHNYEAMTGEKRVIWSGDRKKVIVLVRDTEFDWGDAGTTAGVIEDPIIFGQSADTVLESVSKDDCFINSSKNSDGWMIIAILAMLGCCVVLKRKAC